MMPDLNRYIPVALLASLVAEIAASPYFDLHPRIGGVAAIPVLFLILTLWRYTASQPGTSRLVACVAFAWTGARIAEAFGVSPHISAQVASVLGLALSVATLWLMLRRFSAASATTVGLLTEAFIGYLVVAICFSQIYQIVDRTTTHAFSHIVPPPRGSTMIYFSMVTLSCLGSSDLSPVNPYLKIVTAFESIVGVFYVAVVVARLISFKTDK